MSLLRTTVPLLALLLACFTLECRYGAVDLSLDEIFSAFRKMFSGGDSNTLNERIFIDIRLPRACLSALTGAAIAVGGYLLQSLFRNPLLDPGLIGTSGGAAFGAASCIVFGPAVTTLGGNYALPLFAAAGALAATWMVIIFSTANGSARQSILKLLLAGVAINALCMSGVGFFSYIARDPQARSVTFWNLGRLSGANWTAVSVCAVVVIPSLCFMFFLSKQLSALILGEHDAYYLGVNVKRLKFLVLLINTIMVATVTAFVGVIGFLGLVVPHLARMVYGSDYRKLAIASALGGAIVLTGSDLTARLLLKPAELPIGVVTSIIGVPVFLYLLRTKQYHY